MAAWDQPLRLNRLGIAPQGSGPLDLPGGPPYTLTPALPSTGLAYPPASPHCCPNTTPVDWPRKAALRDWIRAGRGSTGTGISTRCPSTTSLDLALGPDLPWADQLDPGTLSQSAHTFPTCVSLLIPAFSLAYRPQLAHTAASPGTRRSPTHPDPR